MNYIKILFTFFLFVMCSLSMSGQVLSEGAARAELEKRGLTEQEVRTELLARGIDIDQIDPNNPQELLRIEGEIRSVLDFLENKKKEEAATPKVQPTNDPPKVETPNMPNVLPPAPVANEPVTNDVVEQLEEKAVAETVKEIEEIKSQPAEIYGQHIFRDNSLKIYSQIGDFKPSKNYVLGPGDIISVNVWGLSEASFVQEINTDGYIKPDRMPRYYLSGLTVGAAENLLKKAFSSRYYYNKNDFEVAVTSAKVINVNMFGEVGVSGTFSISALNSAFNAIVATGGPTDIGSVRKIKLIRAQSGDVKYLDVYSFLTNPVVAEDFFLLDNDYIHVPIAEKVVNISGAVNRPHRYELIEKEGLIELIDFAGGLKDNALLRTIQITRIENDEQRIIDVNLDNLLNTNQNFELLAGDNVRISSINTGVENNVTINGAVELPGTFAFVSGQKLVDAVSKAKLLENAYTEVVYIRRRNDDKTTITYQKIDLQSALSDLSSDQNIVLKEGDVITIRSQSEFVETGEITVSGAVKNPGSLPINLGANLKISDAIFLSGGLEENAYTDIVYIRRRNDDKVSVSYDFINLGVALSDPSSVDNMTLKEGDVISVRSQTEFIETGEITVSGAVKRPGVLPINADANLKISDAIFLSGGLVENATNFAYLFSTNQQNATIQEYKYIDLKAITNNVNADENVNLERGDRLQFFTVEQFSDEANISVSGAVRAGGDFKYNPTLTLKDALILSGGLRIDASPNRIDIYRVDFLNANKTRTIAAQIELNNKNVLEDDTDYQLQPFDQIIVRSLPEFEYQQSVSIIGEVSYPGSYALLEDNPKLTAVIGRAGGITDEANIAGATLTRGNGIGVVVIDLEKAMRNKNSFANMIVKEGDVINIPKRNAIVSIEGATKYRELYAENLAVNGRINIAFEGKKSAKYYIDKYAGGVDKDADKGDIIVEHSSGKVQKTKDYFFFKKYPKVKEGSSIRVPRKPVDPEKEKAEKEDIDWGKVLADSIAQATTILSLVLLIRTIN